MSPFCPSGVKNNNNKFMNNKTMKKKTLCPFSLFESKNNNKM
jgi:hypothetical protein